MKETTMATLAYSENIEQMAKELDFGGVKGLIKDVLATQILARISGFSEEVEGFEARYGKDYQTINNEFKKANENFKKFDYLMAWQFAQEGKEYWQGRLKELNDVL
jgi:septation ring formation regulator EzrA